jgi:S-disulfanyl-L-cysteine oxidoreductase SoxD
MSNDVRKIILGTLAGFLVLLTVWVGFLFVVACGGSLQCSKANPTPVRTSIPTLFPASLPTLQLGVAQGVSLKCRVEAISLLQAWINSGYPETEPFEFQDSTGTACKATFDDVSPLFKEANTWYPGALPCASCHNSDLTKASAHLDLSSYKGIVAGSRRTSPDAKGKDILGDGVWDDSKLNDVLLIKDTMPLGRPQDIDLTTVMVYAGSAAPGGQSNATPTAPSDVARPSNPGGPGDAVNLTGDATVGQTLFSSLCSACHGTEGKQGIENPGSDDGTVPPLNPIDSTLVNADYKTYATNVDLFIQHGSTPAGSAPAKSMPAWGDQKTITQQQIADVIAYIISLNPAPEPPAEVARPSNPGGPGDAVNLTGDAAAGLKIYTSYCEVCHGTEGKQGVDNPGSEDGTVPPLNPIDSTLIDADYKTYATNVDLFIQHGSTPAGSAPAKLMPAWGDQNTMTQQQIADVIAYIISLNPTK